MKKPKYTETFPIVDGPRHAFDLALCLIDPDPKPLQTFNGDDGGLRHPGFKMDITGIHDKRKRKENMAIIIFLQTYWENPPIHITSLSCGKAVGEFEFKGILQIPSGSVGGDRPEVHARGSYNVTTGKGIISFSKPSSTFNL